MQKNYKDFSKNMIGSSDYAALVLVGIDAKNGLKTSLLHFGEDGSYHAYVVTEKDVTIGSHYKKVAEFQSWLKIYDDNGCVVKFEGERICVYQAGEMGCIIHVEPASGDK